jgi:succinate dehydrogenase / fumarate reductase membrane anchor subunit
MRTALGRVRGLGAARKGVEHWKVQRITSIALVPLGLWFVISAIGLSGDTYAETRAWLASPFNATCMLLLVLAAFYHAQLGVQVIVEDYVHHEGVKVASLLALTFAVFLFGGLSVVSILVVALGSP